MLDDDGQPRVRLRASAVTERKIDELIGLCRGILADGMVTPGEAEFLLDWLQRNRDVSDRWPANVLYDRISRVLADGEIDAEEERELVETLLHVTGAPVMDGETASHSTTLPLNDPPPSVMCEGRSFCLTGKFVCGSRREVEGLVERLGGLVCGTPTRTTHYLVVGTVGSRDWLHSTHGRKIERAVQLREGGNPIAIVSEEWFLACLPPEQIQ